MEIFQLKIREIAQGQYSVFAEDDEDDPSVINFAADAGFTTKLEQISERTFLGIQTFIEYEKVCKEVGGAIFSAFFVGSALRRFREYMQRNFRPRIAIYIPQPLYYLPWELICDTSDPPVQFLSLKGSVTRFDISVFPNADNILYSPPESANFMFLLASPRNRPIGDFEPSDNLNRLRFDKVRPASFNNFTQRLTVTAPYGLIFFGHGEVSQYQGSDCGSLVFVREAGMIFKYMDDDPIYGPNVCDAIIPIEKRTRLIWLAACESAWAINKLSFDKSITGSILDRTRLAFVVGAQAKLDFVAAQKCLESTFNSILNGDPLDLALTNGRIAIRATDPAEQVQTYSWRDWWVPVLYARSTSFEILPVPHPVQLPQPVPKGEASVNEVHSIPQSGSEIREMFTALVRSVGKSI